MRVVRRTKDFRRDSYKCVSGHFYGGGIFVMHFTPTDEIPVFTDETLEWLPCKTCSLLRKPNRCCAELPPIPTAAMHDFLFEEWFPEEVRIDLCGEWYPLSS